MILAGLILGVIGALLIVIGIGMHATNIQGMYRPSELASNHEDAVWTVGVGVALGIIGSALAVMRLWILS